MDCPYFTITRVDSFRINTDPNRKMMDLNAEKGFWTADYELEFYFEDCEGGLTVDDVRYPVKKGYFTCCKPGQMRKMTLPYRCYFFNINTKDQELRKALDSLPMYAFSPRMDEIIEICKEMVAIQNRQVLQSRLLLEGGICKILGLLLSGHDSVPITEDPTVHRHQEILLAADRYIRDHLCENINLEQLSRGSNLHPTYFHKLFTAAFKKSPAEQLMWYRILAAMEMLSGDDRPVAEVASACGFSSQNYFSYKFKETTGLSPTQYRKQRRNKLPKIGT